MNARFTLILAAAAGTASPAAGQELVQVSYSWSEVLAGTLTPVPFPNSILEPGEGALIRLNIYATKSGINAIGQTTAYTPPPPPGTGTFRGIASMTYNLTGDNNAATAYGSWSNRALTPVLSAGPFLGNITNNGATVDFFGGGQYVAPGQTADSTNPIQDAFRGVWDPASYSQRSVRFKGTVPIIGAPGQQNGMIVQYGTDYVDPSDPTTAYALYLTKYIATDFGTGVNIPISPVPAPPAAALLALGAAWTGRRRRPR